MVCLGFEPLLFSRSKSVRWQLLFGKTFERLSIGGIQKVASAFEYVTKVFKKCFL